MNIKELKIAIIGIIISSFIAFGEAVLIISHINFTSSQVDSSSSY